jgi:hypothetical protein
MPSWIPGEDHLINFQTRCLCRADIKIPAHAQGPTRPLSPGRNINSVPLFRRYQNPRARSRDLSPAAT